MKIKHIHTNKITDISYDGWVDSIKIKTDYLVLDWGELVMWQTVDNSGNLKDQKVLDKDHALRILEKDSQKNSLRKLTKKELKEVKSNVKSLTKTSTLTKKASDFYNKVREQFGINKFWGVVLAGLTVLFIWGVLSLLVNSCNSKTHEESASSQANENVIADLELYPNKLDFSVYLLELVSKNLTGNLEMLQNDDLSNETKSEFEYKIRGLLSDNFKGEVKIDEVTDDFDLQGFINKVYRKSIELPVHFGTFETFEIPTGKDSAEYTGRISAAIHPNDNDMPKLVNLYPTYKLTKTKKGGYLVKITELIFDYN